LFDVHSISIACESLFSGQRRGIIRLWRTKQLEYTWLRSLMERYAEFEIITRDALGMACRTLAWNSRRALQRDSWKDIVSYVYFRR